MQMNLPQETADKKANECKRLMDPISQLQQIEKQEFELGIAPDEAYVKCDFIKGDVVVYSHRIADNSLETVDAFQAAEYYWLEGGQIIRKDDIKLASPAELKAKRGLDPPAALFISGEL